LIDESVIQTRVGVRAGVKDRQLIVLNHRVWRLRAVVILVSGKLVAA